MQSVQSRGLTEKELKTLKKIRSATQKDIKSSFKTHYYILAIVLGVGGAWLATSTDIKILTFLLGTVSVTSFAYFIFGPIEVYKNWKGLKSKLNEVESILERNTIEVSLIAANRVAVAKEFEDEGDLYIIEMTDNRLLYLWDTEYHLRKSFPTLQFEMYEGSFHRLYGRILNPLGEKTAPIIIEPKKKRAYMLSEEIPAHGAIDRRSFDKLVDAMSNAKMKEEKKAKAVKEKPVDRKSSIRKKRKK